ncbi:MAG: ribulose-phosphate 3-epimerase [Bacteroidales bacterium]|jgi:ribulose-phosphate 3-epimerase|nr:ribulose-phosphate 3-epimerase [Bacteroidales bacterium]
MKRYISPSILAADFNDLEKEIRKINNSNATWIHCDVMDGVFVPNISFGVPVIEAISRIAEKPLDVHLMIVEPAKYIDKFCSIGLDILTIHQEACSHLQRGIQQIKENGVKAGVSLSPHTPVTTLTDVIEDLDLVLIMSVNPGFGGQKFIENTYRKVGELKNMIEKSNSNALIQVDGGITMQNARQLFDSGVNILVTGTTVFKSNDPAKTVDELLAV